MNGDYAWVGWFIIIISIALAIFGVFYFINKKNDKLDENERKKEKDQLIQTIDNNEVVILSEVEVVVKKAQERYLVWKNTILDKPSIQEIYKIWTEMFSEIIENIKFKSFADMSQKFGVLYRKVKELSLIKPNIIFDYPEQNQKLLEDLNLGFLLFNI